MKTPQAEGGNVNDVFEPTNTNFSFMGTLRFQGHRHTLSFMGSWYVLVTHAS